MKRLIVLVAVVAFMASAAPALAFGCFGFFCPMPAPGNDLTVSNSNSATVTNTVYTYAITGNNKANGGDASNVVTTSGGWGGTGSTVNDVDGGDAGVVVTGNAGAWTTVMNDINYNKTKIVADCNCTGDVAVVNGNNATLSNYNYTYAHTGSNTATGGTASNTVVGSSGWWWGGSGSSNNDVTGGNGGEIYTGSAGSESAVTNLVNTNVTRVIRTGSLVR